MVSPINCCAWHWKQQMRTPKAIFNDISYKWNVIQCPWRQSILYHPCWGAQKSALGVFKYRDTPGYCFLHCWYLFTSIPNNPTPPSYPALPSSALGISTILPTCIWNPISNPSDAQHPWQHGLFSFFLAGGVCAICIYEVTWVRP